MVKAGLVLILIALVGFLGLAVGVALMPFPEKPSPVHAWMPTPAICAGYACVTWAQWHKAHVPGKDAMDVLTVLIEEKAFSVLARSKSVTITDEEVRIAIDAADHVLSSSGGSSVAGASQYREMRSILLREKLIADGMLSPFDVPLLSSVRVWHAYARWDEDQRRIESAIPPWRN